MSFFDQVFSKIFPSPEKVAKGELPVISQPIGRNEKYLKKFQTWLYDGSKDLLIENLKKEIDQSFHTGSEYITQLSTKGAKGFIIHPGEIFKGVAEAQYLLDYWERRVAGLNYTHYSSHSESFIKRNNVLMKERYYLKPRVKSFSPPVNQEYGNVLFEMQLLGEELLFLKCLVTFYTGYNYQPPKNYKKLLQVLTTAQQD